MKKIRPCRSACLVAVVLLILLLCSGCGEKETVTEPQGKVYFQYFDTVSYVYSYAGDSAEQFDSCSAEVAIILEQYHRLFDIYHEYSGITNLCTINRLAGKEAVKVQKELFDFLVYAKELYYLTEGEMNIMLGPVLSLWHDSRELASADPGKATLPDEAALIEAGKHCSIDSLVLDKENSTVFISDPKSSIDVGAVGKGYAVEKAAQYLESNEKDAYVLNVGGNLRIIGTRSDGSGWRTAIKNPMAPSEAPAMELILSDTSCVTSGSYERYFTVNGQKYHHIIDKDTLYPAGYFSSVSVITPDSGLADCLSTALFCMSREQGMKLLEKFPEAEAVWIGPDGEINYTKGILSLMKTDNLEDKVS